jgi:hypothetical protein
LVTAVFFAVFILACPGALQDFVTGGDYLVNAIYVGVAVDLVARTYPCSRASRWASYGFLAIAISSRAVYGIVTPVLAIFLWQRGGRRAAIEFVGAVTIFVLAINGPFYAYDPAQFAPLTLGGKLEAVPQWTHPIIALPVISILVACLSVFARLDRRSLFSAIALAYVPIFVPPLIFDIAASGWTLDGLTAANYVLPITIYGGMSLVCRLKRGLVPVAHDGMSGLTPHQK